MCKPKCKNIQTQNAWHNTNITHGRLTTPAVAKQQKSVQERYPDRTTGPVNDGSQKG